MNDAKSRLTFFRQSGWMMFTAVASGAFMYAVHAVAGRMPKAEYGVFSALLAVTNLMGALVSGIAIVFTQKAAEALHEAHERELAGMLRGVLRAIFVVWLVAAGLIFLFRHQVLASFKVTNPAALWLTVAIGLVAMWLPVMLGLLQGRQDFLWLGCVNILNGVGRFAAVAVAVLALGWYAAGAVGAVLCGFASALLLGAWHNRRYLRLKPAPVDWSAWWRQVVPLTLGMSAATFMLLADMPFVQKFFPESQTGYYAAAGLIGRALVYFVQALTTVLFPKIVQSLARAQKTDVLAQALGATALVGGAAAIGCTLFPTLPLRIVYNRTFLDVAGPLVPWFAWSMLPLTLSNVLVTSLLARRRFAAVPWMVAVAVAYGLFLYFRHDTFRTVIGALGAFNFLLLLVCAWFSWRGDSAKPEAEVKPAV
jgi:O-antigen/teichoic acid export membrane protein